MLARTNVRLSVGKSINKSTSSQLGTFLWNMTVGYIITRRNDLMNQVEFLGLVHTFSTVSPSNIENILHQTLSRDGYKFY